MNSLWLSRRRFLTWSSAGLASTTLGPILTAASRASAASSGNLTIATAADSEPASLDGQVDPYVTAWLLNSFVPDPLVYLTSGGKYLPMLATRWTISSEGRIWTVSLRTGITFQDGTPLDADAVKFNIDRVMSPETHSALMANYLGVKNFLKADVLDKATVRIIYGSPVPALLYGLSIFPLWSPTAVRQYGSNYQQHLSGEGGRQLGQWG